MISRIGAGNYIGKYALSCTQDIPVFFRCFVYNLDTVGHHSPSCMQQPRLGVWKVLDNPIYHPGEGWSYFTRFGKSTMSLRYKIISSSL